MSIEYCHTCNLHVDTDFNLEHFEYCDSCGAWCAEKHEQCPGCKEYSEKMARSILPKWFCDQQFGASA